MRQSRTISVLIAKPPEGVYDYLADPRHYPEWSEFITQIRPEGNDWVATTPIGEVRITFTPRNPYFIVDHLVRVAPESVVAVPMRVVRNEEGSEVLFTVRRLPEMTDEQYGNDLGIVKRDLANLKRVVEAK